MFKLRVVSINKLITSPLYMPLLAIIVLMLAFIGYKSWQEYQIYKINEAFQSFPTASGDSTLRIISWFDNADDEDGYVVERKNDGSYVVITTLEADSIYYEDYSPLISGTYCYRVGAYNQAGTAYSEAFCVEVQLEPDPIPDPDPLPIPPDGGVISIVAEFSGAPGNIALNGREFYGVKSDYSLNSDFSTNEITDVNFSIDSGSLSYKNSSKFIFMEDGGEVENGYISMRYNELNNFSFMLVGNGNEQVATLYIAAGAWSLATAELEVKAGGISEIITLPSNYTWHYIQVDITFTQSTLVELTPVGQHGSYSGVQMAGIVLNNSSTADDPELPDDPEQPSFASLLGIDQRSSSSIDVSASEYITSTGIHGNEVYSEGSVIDVAYTGKSKYRDSSYLFLDNDEVVASGYTGMSWIESNKITVNLNSSVVQPSLASLYFKAGAWTKSKPIELELIINGESSLIELSRGYAWFYIRADIEFAGALTVELKPVGRYRGYSQLYFAGMTLQE